MPTPIINIVIFVTLDFIILVSFMNIVGFVKIVVFKIIGII